jgi:hypothetical protein
MGILRQQYAPALGKMEHMILRRQTTTSLLLFVLASATWAHAQFEVPNEIFQRTLLIRSGNEQATALKFDQGGRIYLVTTRHFGRHLSLTNAVVQVGHDQTWSDLQTVRTFFPASKEVDLAILETGERVVKPYAVVKSSEVLTTGQKVWFMGSLGPLHLPPDMPDASPPFFSEIPFVKIGTISAINPTQPDSFEIHLQGSYGLLIAGGPIIYWSPAHRDYEILGVVKRNERDAVRVPIDGKPDQEVVKSGIVHGYSIDVVVDAINDNPPS